MKLHCLNLNDIKSFSGTHTFDFSQSDKINTISGINGSGKTTIFKCAILAQKIFFANLYNEQNETKIDFTKDALNIFSKSNSYIHLIFTFEDETLASFIIFCRNRKKEFIDIELIADELILN